MWYLIVFGSIGVVAALALTSWILLCIGSGTAEKEFKEYDDEADYLK